MRGPSCRNETAVRQELRIAQGTEIDRRPLSIGKFQLRDTQVIGDWSLYRNLTLEIEIIE